MNTENISKMNDNICKQNVIITPINRKTFTNCCLCVKLTVTKNKYRTKKGGRKVYNYTSADFYGKENRNC